MIFTRTRKRDGATVFYIRYLGPGSPRRLQVTEKVGVLKDGYTQRQEARMRTKAMTELEERRLEVENGTWVHPPERQPEPVLTFRQPVKEFLGRYESRSGSMDY